MFGISNRIAYDGQMVHAPGPRSTGAIGSVLGPSKWLDIEGEADSKWCPAEGELVVTLLKKIAAAGITDPDLFIITPFRIVAQELRRRLEGETQLLSALRVDAQGSANNRVGTIHSPGSRGEYGHFDPRRAEGDPEWRAKLGGRHAEHPQRCSVTGEGKPLRCWIAWGLVRGWPRSRTGCVIAASPSSENKLILNSSTYLKFDSRTYNYTRDRMFEIVLIQCFCNRSKAKAFFCKVPSPSGKFVRPSYSAR